MASADLSPAVGTRLTGDGVVMLHTVSRFGLHRVVVETEGRYPDLVKWLAMLPPSARVMTHHHAERFNNVFIGMLEIYFKG